MALPKANRLSSRHDFRAVFREGIRLKSPNLTLRALRLNVDLHCHLRTPTQSAPLLAETLVKPTKIGISISTKVSKRAVIRNRMRRQLQAAFRCLLPRLIPGWLVVVIVQPSAAQGCDYQQFLQELEQLLVEAEVINGNS